MSKNIATDIACAGQSRSTTTSFSVELYEYGGTLRARWKSNTDMEPNYATLYLYLGDKVELKHKTGASKGEHDFKITRGRGFRLALMANDFSGDPVEVVSTAVSGHEELPEPVTKKYVFTMSLAESDRRAVLKWESDAPFRPRQSEAKLFIEGEEKHQVWIEQPNGSYRFEDVRWGVGLAAAYTAENYGGQKMDLVRTPETKR